MAESVIADFTARFVGEGLTTDKPVRGRILLSQKRLVLAAADTKLTVPLSAIFDIAVGFVPPELQAFFSDSVTIAYRRNGRKLSAVIESESDNVDKFTTVLFKVLLNGQQATVKHPARVGGRVTDAAPQSATLALRPRAVTFNAERSSFTIDLATVSRFVKKQREIGGSSRTVLLVRHMPEHTTLESMIALPTDRRMNLLSRYLRLEYDDMMAELEDVSLTEDQVQALVTIYTAGEDAGLVDMLGVSPSQATMVLNSLQDEGLVVDGETAVTLTAKGRAVVSDRIESVNT